MQAIASSLYLFFPDVISNDEIWYKIASNQKWNIIDSNSILCIHKIYSMRGECSECIRFESFSN